MEHFVRPPIEVICYTAGLLDGEGSVFRVHGANRFGFSRSQSPKNNGEQLCRWLSEQWGIGNVNPQTKRWGEQEHVQWHWTVNAAHEVQHGLGLMLPYLRVKREAAERALAHIQQRLADGVRFLWTPGEIAYLREHYDESDSSIGRVIKRSTNAIAAQRIVLGLPRVARAECFWNDIDDQYLRDNWQQLDDAELGAKLGRSAHSVKHQRCKLGLLRE